MGPDNVRKELYSPYDDDTLVQLWVTVGSKILRTRAGQATVLVIPLG